MRRQPKLPWQDPPRYLDSFLILLPGPFHTAAPGRTLGQGVQERLGDTDHEANQREKTRRQFFYRPAELARIYGGSTEDYGRSICAFPRTKRSVCTAGAAEPLLI